MGRYTITVVLPHITKERTRLVRATLVSEVNLPPICAVSGVMSAGCILILLAAGF